MGGTTIKIGTVIWGTLFIASVVYFLWGMRKGKSSKGDADKKNHIWPFLAILVALLGLAWSQMPGFFNKRIDIPRNTAQSEDIEGDTNIAAQIYTTLVDGTPISELGSRITMSSTLIENSEWYKDGHIIVASPAGENFKYKCGEVDITDADRVFLNINVRNDNPDSENIAHGVRIYFDIPDESGTELTVKGRIYAENADPQQREDEVTLYADRPFRLEYAVSSTYMYNRYFGWNSPAEAEQRVADRIIDPPGALVGFKRFDGDMPGGEQSNIVVCCWVRWE